MFVVHNERLLNARCTANHVTFLENGYNEAWQHSGNFRNPGALNMSWNQPSSNQTSYTSPQVADIRDERVSAFLSKVYGWMFVGLLITAVVAFAVASSPALIETLLANRLMFWGLLIAQLGLVFYLSARVDKVAPATAAGLFALYSALVGVTSSVILLIYTGSSITQTFIITAGMFGATAVFGTVTKRSLAGLGQFMFMGLIGLLLAMIVGFFWQSDALQFVISVVGVLVFTGLTAWDAQRLKQMAVALPDGRAGSYAVVGALSLYLDFINLFFFLLRLTGSRRN
jgi:FtsH-binding integral membrane protein